MRIDALRINGFGKLAGAELVFPPGKTAIVVDCNEAGKSTLAGAILYGVCDFPPARGTGPKGAIRPDKAFRPWDGGPFAVQLDITVSGRQISITRDFDKRTCIITDRRTGKDVTSDFAFGSDLAAQIFGLPREDFERIAFVRGKDAHKFDASSGLTSRLSAIVENSQSGAEEALTALASVKVRLDGSGEIKPESALGRLGNLISANERRMAKLEDDLASKDYQSLLGKQSRLAELDAQITDANQMRAAARLSELRARVAAADAVAKDLAQFEEERANLEKRAHTYAVAPQEADLQGVSVELAKAQDAASNARHKQGEVAAQEGRFRSEGIDVSAIVDFTAKMDALSAEDAAFLAHLTSDRLEANGLAAKADASAASARSRLESLQAERRAASRMGKGLAFFGLAAAAVMGILLALGKAGTAAAVGAGLAGAIATIAGIVWSLLAQNKRSDEAARFRLEAETAERDAEDTTNRISKSEARLVALATAMGYADAALLDNELGRWERGRDRVRPILDAKDAVCREENAAAEAENRARSIFSRLGVDSGYYTRSDLEHARDQLAAHLSIAVRVSQLRDELIPQAKRRIVSAEELSRIKNEMAHICSEYGADLPNPTASVAEAEQIARSLAEERNRLSDEAGRLGTSVASEIEAYRREYPQLLEETSSLKRKEASIRQFALATELAAQTLREVSEESRRKWADALNSGSSTILQRFCPSYDTFLFDDNLDFTVRSAESGRQLQKPEIDSCLSTGAKDQLYIAFKLACCDELSMNQESLPVILDDPLIACDDTRFADALEYLVTEYAARHQIIILTCHKARHEQALARNGLAERCVVVGVSG